MISNTQFSEGFSVALVVISYPNPAFDSDQALQLSSKIMAAFPVRDGYPSFLSDHTNKIQIPTRHFYVNNLSPKVEEHELLHLFSWYGDIESRGFQKGRKYQFICYMTVEAATMAVKQLNNFPLHRLPMEVEYRRPFAVAGIPAGNVKAEYSYGPKRLKLGWIPPPECTSQDSTDSGMTMHPAKRMRYDSVPENLESGRLASFSKPAELDCSKKYIWEGTFAKGGVSTCSVRCYLIQKTLDVVFPQILKFTSKLDLQILTDHLSQVADDAGVVCFEPRSHNDARNYHEFMNYLYKQKKKAAVAKLNEIDHLIIVPPFNISESVLKAPERSSIVGFMKRLKHPNWNTRIAENEDVRSHMGTKELHGEMIPFQSNPVQMEPALAATYLATLQYAGEIFRGYGLYGGSSSDHHLD